jgi:hypothetical protein
MPANSFAAIRPDDTNHAGEFIRRYSPRRYESCRRIHSPLFARDVATPRDHRIPQSSPRAPTGPHAVGANHAGEFIRRYSPVTIRIMPANSFAPIRPDDTNHAGEFIRPYSPVTAPREHRDSTLRLPRQPAWNDVVGVIKNRTGGKCPQCVMITINR